MNNKENQKPWNRRKRNDNKDLFQTWVWKRLTTCCVVGLRAPPPEGVGQCDGREPKRERPGRRSSSSCGSRRTQVVALELLTKGEGTERPWADTPGEGGRDWEVCWHSWRRRRKWWRGRVLKLLAKKEEVVERTCAGTPDEGEKCLRGGGR